MCDDGAECTLAAIACRCFLGCFAAAQTNQIYFISACTNSFGPATFPSTLHRFDESKGHLIPIRALVPADEGTHRIVYDPELRFWAAGYPHVVSNSFTLVYFDSPEREQKVKLKAEEASVIEAHAFGKPSGSTIGVYYFGKRKQVIELLREIRVSSGEVKDGDWNDFRFARVPGPAGGIQPAKDSVISVFPFADGRLVYRYADRAIESGIQLPETMRYSQEDDVFASVLSSQLVVLRSLRTSTAEKNSIGEAVFRIGDRMRNSWHEWIVKGDVSTARGWRNWLAVAVASTGLKDKLSPGAGERRQEITDTGFPFDMHWHKQFYFPGTLLIYNTETRKQYVIETGQGDSEVLLIEDGLIYYRTNDKIWRGRIDASSITEVDLLLKSAIVPDIHWAFRSKPPRPAPKGSPPIEKSKWQATNGR